MTVDEAKAVVENMGGTVVGPRIDYINGTHYVVYSPNGSEEGTYSAEDFIAMVEGLQGETPSTASGGAYPWWDQSKYGAFPQTMDVEGYMRPDFNTAIRIVEFVDSQSPQPGDKTERVLHEGVEEGGVVFDVMGYLDAAGNEVITRRTAQYRTKEPINSIDDMIREALVTANNPSNVDDPGIIKAQALFEFKNQINNRQINHTIAMDKLSKALEIAQSPSDYMTLVGLYTGVLEQEDPARVGERIAPLAPLLQEMAHKFFLDIPGINEEPDSAIIDHDADRAEEYTAGDGGGGGIPTGEDTTPGKVPATEVTPTLQSIADEKNTQEMKDTAAALKAEEIAQRRKVMGLSSDLDDSTYLDPNASLQDLMDYLGVEGMNRLNVVGDIDRLPSYSKLLREVTGNDPLTGYGSSTEGSPPPTQSYIDEEYSGFNAINPDSDSAVFSTQYPHSQAAQIIPDREVIPHAGPSYGSRLQARINELAQTQQTQQTQQPQPDIDELYSGISTVQQRAPVTSTSYTPSRQVQLAQIANALPPKESIKENENWGDYVRRTGIKDPFAETPSFDKGGWVPGRLGTPQNIIAHAGEAIVTRPQVAAIEGALDQRGLFGDVYRPSADALPDFLKRPRRVSLSQLTGGALRPRSLQTIRNQSPTQRTLMTELAKGFGVPANDFLEEEQFATKIGGSQPRTARFGGMSTIRSS